MVSPAVANPPTLELTAEEISVVRDSPYFHAIGEQFDEFGTIEWFNELEPPAYGPTLNPVSTIRQQLDRLETARLVLDRWITVFEHLEAGRLSCESWLVDAIRTSIESFEDGDSHTVSDANWIRPVEVMYELVAALTVACDPPVVA